MKRLVLIVLALCTVSSELTLANNNSRSKYQHHSCNCGKDFNYEVREEKVKQILANDWSVYEQELKQALQSFPSNSHNLVIEKLLLLLDAEMMLVDNLIHGVSGSAMECSMHERNDQMRKATPDVVSVYEKIMNLATFDERLYPEYQSQWSRRPNHAVSLKLGRHEKRDFLERMLEVLSNYYDQFSNVQYGKMANASGVNTEVSTDIELLDFCPIVR
jgi:hypothetical protein